jgi:uncharacterized repeat protein (TIGR03803 family)
LAGLIMDTAGTLYGTTESGGAKNGGTVYKLVPTSSGATETVLYSFCSQTSCADGLYPGSGLIMDGSGNLYGTTIGGGNYYCGTYHTGPCGVAFQLTNTGPVLSVSVAVSPGGGVTSSPAGIDCGTTCSAAFAQGTQVTLTATPAVTWGLAGWGGACSGVGNCTVTMNASTSVSATFTTLFLSPPVPQLDPALPPALISPLPVAPTAF